MRAIQPPALDPKEVYSTCTSSISDQGLRERLNEITDLIKNASDVYHQQGLVKQLYSIARNNSDKAVVVLGQVTKQELIDLYSNQLVNKTKPGRAYYDYLKELAPYGKCPYCGIGFVSTLDHYLPKTTFPQLSVVPLNLVPSCKDCNTGKTTASANRAEEQYLHPYYDHDHFINDQWLYAEVIESSPPTIRFYVQAPENWDQVSKDRINIHFDDFELANRYKVESSTEMAILRDYLTNLPNLSPEMIKEHLVAKANSLFNIHKNFWQGAMIQALSESDWYCGGGFR